MGNGIMIKSESLSKDYWTQQVRDIYPPGRVVHSHWSGLSRYSALIGWDHDVADASSLMSSCLHGIRVASMHRKRATISNMFIYLFMA